MVIVYQDHFTKIVRPIINYIISNNICATSHNYSKIYKELQCNVDCYKCKLSIKRNEENYCLYSIYKISTIVRSYRTGDIHQVKKAMNTIC